MNVRLLRRIAKVIQEKPREFDINYWHRDKKAPNKANPLKKGNAVGALCELPKERQVACGTVHCIAGWAQILSPDRDCKQDAEYDAKRLLGLELDEADRLFFAYNWPRGFGGDRATAAQAAARIEHFIKTKGAE